MITDMLLAHEGFYLAKSRSPRAAFVAGMKDATPLVVGAIPSGIIFGALATTVLTPAATVAMSALVNAGSAQFIAVGLLRNGVAVPIIVLTTLVINLRHMLYGTSLGPYLKHLKQRWLIPLGFWMDDETYLVATRRFQQGMEPALRQWYFLGSALAMNISWQLSALVGIVAGQRIPDPQNWGLDFALVVTFIGMIVPAMKDRSAVTSVIVAGAVAVIANGLPNKLGLIAAALAGVIAGMVARSLLNEPGAVRIDEEGAA